MKIGPWLGIKPLRAFAPGLPLLPHLSVSFPREWIQEQDPQGSYWPPLRISCSYKMHCACLFFNIYLPILEKISNWELFNISDYKYVLTWCSLCTDKHNTSTELSPRQTPLFLLRQIRRARFLIQKSQLECNLSYYFYLKIHFKQAKQMSYGLLVT